jgi:prenylcysteine alpha-carboxyl methylesterase
MLRDIPGVASSLPAVLLCHGNADGSAPPSESARFAEALRAAGSQARSILHWFPYDRVRVVNAVP